MATVPSTAEAPPDADSLGDERDPDFKRLWTAQTISMAGSTVTNVAVPLTLLAMGASSLQFSLMFTAQTLPKLFAPVIAAPVVDRFHRKQVLIGADIVRCTVLATMPIAALFGILSIPHIYVVLMILGASDSIALTASRAYLPSIVRRSALVACNGRLEAGLNVSSSAVPGLAGLLMKIVSAPLTILIDCCSYVASALLLRSIRRVEPPLSVPGQQPTKSFRDGFKAIFADKMLTSIIFAHFIVNFIHGMFYTQIVPYMARDLKVTSTIAISLAFGAVSVGALIGSFMRFTGPRKSSKALAIGVLLCAAAIGLSTAAGVFVPALAMLGATFVLGMGQSIFVVHNVSLRQQASPRELLARVNAIGIMLGPGLWPLGGLLGGALAQLLGHREAFLVASGLMAMIAVWITRSPLRHFDQRSTSNA